MVSAATVLSRLNLLRQSSPHQPRLVPDELAGPSGTPPWDCRRRRRHHSKGALFAISPETRQLRTRERERVRQRLPCNRGGVGIGRGNKAPMNECTKKWRERSKKRQGSLIRKAWRETGRQWKGENSQHHSEFHELPFWQCWERLPCWKTINLFPAHCPTRHGEKPLNLSSSSSAPPRIQAAAAVFIRVPYAQQPGLFP